VNNVKNLNRIAQQYNIDTTSRDWPRASNSLTKRLRPLLTNLREGLGIHIVLGRTTTGSNKNKNISIIRIWKESPPSPPSPPVKSLNHSESSGGSIVSGDCAFTEQYVSPPQIAQNHAQNLESGGSRGSGGCVSNLVITNARSYPNALPNRYIAFDFEWSTQIDRLPNRIPAADIPTQITAAAFVDSLGNNTVLHIADFYDSDNPEYNLLLQIIQELTSYELVTLTRSVRLSKNPEDYQNTNDRKRRLGITVGAKKGDIIEYYESDNSKAGYSTNYQDISIRKYKLMLWKAIKEILEIAGYDVRSLENEIGVTSKDM
jgi:hypothetical protein